VCESREGTADQGLIGVCTSCDCRGCDGGQTCDAHLCVDDSCVGVSCEAGKHCVTGNCVDNCEDAQCPAGQICESGGCIQDPNGAGGASGSGDGSGGNDDGGGIVIRPDGDAGAGAGTDGSGHVGGDDVAIEAKGCSCQTPGGATGSGALALVALALGGAIRRRRKLA
jgi:MYXO-CTERM domain-containing protein